MQNRLIQITTVCRLASCRTNTLKPVRDVLGARSIRRPSRA
jgi:glyceraldehyde-3-phosphate dehydrogenase/erythrose-4-phosphate dehydrogenase